MIEIYSIYNNIYYPINLTYKLDIFNDGLQIENRLERLKYLSDIVKKYF